MSGITNTAVGRMSAGRLAQTVSNPQTWCLATGAVASVALAIGVKELRSVPVASQADLVTVIALPEMPPLGRGFQQRGQSELAAMRRIDVLLARANADMAALRLTHPPGRSAWDQFAAVLNVEPDNADAYRGFTRIAERYLALASTARSAGESGRARRHACKATAVQRASLLINEPAVVGRKALQGAFENCIASGSRVS